MVRTLSVVTLLVACGINLSSPQDAAEIKTTKIQGVWIWDAKKPQSTAEPRIDVTKLVVDGDKMTVHYKWSGGTSASCSVFKLDTAVKPHRIDFVPDEGGNKGKAYLGLVELSGDSLKLCYRGPGSDRPKSFDDKQAGNSATSYLYLKAPNKDN